MPNDVVDERASPAIEEFRRIPSGSDGINLGSDVWPNSIIWSHRNNDGLDARLYSSGGQTKDFQSKAILGMALAKGASKQDAAGDERCYEGVCAD